MPRFEKVLQFSSLIVAGAVLVYMFEGRRSGRRSSERELKPEPEPMDIVEVSSIQSFPASDPPQWTQGALT